MMHGPINIRYSTCFGHYHCPSSGVSQHCIYAIRICILVLLVSANVVRNDKYLLVSASVVRNDKYLFRVYSVEILPMMDSGHVRNM